MELKAKFYKNAVEVFDNEKCLRIDMSPTTLSEIDYDEFIDKTRARIRDFFGTNEFSGILLAIGMKASYAYD